MVDLFYLFRSHPQPVVAPPPVALPKRTVHVDPIEYALRSAKIFVATMIAYAFEVEKLPLDEDDFKLSPCWTFCTVMTITASAALFCAVSYQIFKLIYQEDSSIVLSLIKP